MKKVLVYCLIFCLTFCSCGKKENKTDNTNVFIKSGADYYQNGIIMGDETAMFLDFDTMEKAPLCAVPNCTHSSSDCLAKNVGKMPVFYDEHIYYFCSNGGNVRETPDGQEFFIDSRLMKASLSSSETQVVCEFNDCVPLINYDAYVLHNNELYFIGDDCNPVKGEYGGYSWGNSGGCHFICSINLDTGEYTNYGSIYDGDKEYEGADYSSCAGIEGVYNNNLYIRYSFIKDNEALQSGNADIDNLYERLNFEFDFSTKNLKETDMPFSRYMTDNIYTYYDSDTKELNILTNGETKTLAIEHEPIVFSIFNNKLFDSSNGMWYDLDDMSEHSMGKYYDYYMVAYNNGSYIFIKGSKAVKLTENELLALNKE